MEIVLHSLHFLTKSLYACAINIQNHLEKTQKVKNPAMDYVLFRNVKLLQTDEIRLITNGKVALYHELHREMQIKFTDG